MADVHDDSNKSRFLKMSVDRDPFDDLLSLEDEFYKEGYNLGISDGKRAGLIEGRGFGLEKGFEKYLAMGAMHGRAMVWAGRQVVEEGQHSKSQVKKSDGDASVVNRTLEVENEEASVNRMSGKVPNLSANTRLEGHIRTLYALTEPDSLSTENSEISVSDFDDRLKRAQGKFRVVGKFLGEAAFDDDGNAIISRRQGVVLNAAKRKGDGSIEDISSLHARH